MNLKKREALEKKNPEFVDEVVRLTADQLEARIVSLAKHQAEVEQAKEDDLELAQASELAKDLNAPYKDSLKAVKEKTQYLLHLLAEKGKM